MTSASPREHTSSRSLDMSILRYHGATDMGYQKSASKESKSYVHR